MPDTRASVRRRQTEVNDGGCDIWLPLQVQQLIIDKLLDSLRVPAPPQTGLYVLPQGARRVVELQLVCRAWRSHVQDHPDALMSLRLHRLLRLAYVHDYVHFIVDSHKRATKARMIPTRISLPYFTHTINSGRTSATTATSAGKPFSQGQDPRSHSSTATIEQGTDSHGSGTDGSAAAVTGQADSVAVTELRLSVMTGKVRACQDFGLPASCCVLTCTLDEVSAPVTVLTLLAAELQLLDQIFHTSLILTLTLTQHTHRLTNPHPTSTPNSPQAHAPHAVLPSASDTQGKGTVHTQVAATASAADAANTWRHLLSVGADACAARREELLTEAARCDAAWPGMSVRQRLRCLAMHAIAPHFAVESSVQDGGASGGKKGVVRCQGGGLLLIPTFSRINRRVMYNAQDPIGHLDL